MGRASPVQLRRATIADAETLSDLGALSFTETFGHLYSVKDLTAFLEKGHSVAAYKKDLADPGAAVWIAETDDGEAVGYCVACPCGLPVPDLPENAGELGRIYVLQSHQGTGLGKKFLETALQWLDAHFQHIYLSVFAENHGAQRLYASYGFEKIHEYFYMVGDHADPEWIMERRHTNGVIAS